MSGTLRYWPDRFWPDRFWPAVASAGALLLSMACGSDSPPPSLRNFDRPTEIAFACFGDLVVDGSVTTSAQPLSSCVAHQGGTPPVGQELAFTPNFFAFVLQASRGTMAVINVAALGVQDTDPLTPGLNDIPVGTLPVGIAEDASGCFVLTANSGSCDLAAVDVTSALSLLRPARVNRYAFMDPSGAQIRSKPRALVTGPQTGEVGTICPQLPVGNVYVAYPACKMVAAVSAGTGVIQNALIFREDGTVEIASPEDYEACPVECGEVITAVALSDDVDAGVPPELFEETPVAMEVSADGTKLYVASETSPFLTIADLDVDGLPTGTVRRLRLDGDVGIKKFAISGRIDMGGDEREGKLELPIGEFQFAYVIATDSTIRVLDLDNEVECDTQVDPRYLKDITDVNFLSCMPVGDPRTPPRRFGAQGPGIQLPGGFQVGRNSQTSLAVPLDISFATAPAPENRAAIASPDTMIGTFAFVTASSGFVFVINVDDDNYADTELSTADDPVSTSLPLALPHQLRDNVVNREALSANCGTPAVTRSELGARLMDSPQQLIDPSLIAPSKVHEMPFLRGVGCEGEDALGNPLSSVITELSFAADDAIRERSFPDLRVVENQVWSLTWEGSLSGDGLFVHIDGPPIRNGSIQVSGTQTFLRDRNEPFCSMGAEPFDIAVIAGCDPLLNDAQCGIGETCFVHPETPFAVGTGVCLPSDQVEQLIDPCKDFFVSRRRYSILSTAKGEVELAERRRMLRTTPLDGCESAVQCEMMADAEPLLALDEHPLEAVLPAPDPDYTWVCEPDPSRVPGVDRCIMSCESKEDCENGFHCSANRCVEAPLPPTECTPAVQRYAVLAGEAFAVLGVDDGFIHSNIADPASGQCVPSPTAHPLAVGRLPLRPPPCDDDGDFTTGPNPCSTRIDHTETYTPYTIEGKVCVPQDATQRVRDVSAVLFSNAAITFHLVDNETQGDLDCRFDQAGTGPAFATTFGGYQIQLDVGGGFSPKIVPNLEAALPVTIVPGPTGRLWVLDQGDSSGITRGRVFRINPIAPAAFDLTTIL